MYLRTFEIDLFQRKNYREGGREKKRLKLEPGASSGSPTWVAVACVLWSSSTSFPGTVVGRFDVEQLHVNWWPYGMLTS